MTNQINGRPIHRAQTNLKTETADGHRYFRVEFREGENTIMPAPFLAHLSGLLDNPDFAFGVVEKRFVFLFRNRKDAKRCQQLLRQVVPAPKDP